MSYEEMDFKPCVVARAFSPREQVDLWQVESSLVYVATPGMPALHSETLSPNKKEKKRRRGWSLTCK